MKPPTARAHFLTMAVRFALFLLALGLAACAAPAPVPATAAPGARPLDVLPPGFDPALVRADLLATARDRFGPAAVARALAAPTHAVVKRFAGMPPPPPPGAGPDWRAPTPAALLVRDRGRWLVATAGGWRAAGAAAAAELDAILADPLFWSEPAYVPPCPDAGASLLLLRVAGRRETIRNSTCTSRAERAVSAALAA